MNQTLRVLKLLRELPRGQGTEHSTATALAQRLQTAERTIYRDLMLLKQAAYPVANRGQGYYLLATERALPVELNADEIGVLLRAVQWVHEVLPEGLGSDPSPILDKLTAACGSRDALVDTLEQDPGFAIYPSVTDGPQALRNTMVALRARRQCRKLRGLYHSPDRDETTERVLHPYAVVYRGDAHYVVAFCELRGQERTFRLDRFSELEMLDAPADIPDDYDLDHHFAGAWQVTGGRRRRVRVLLKGKTARRLRSQRVHPSQQVVRADAGQFEIELHVAITDEFRSWLLGLGAEAEVLSPTSLRRQLSQIARDISANYGST